MFKWFIKKLGDFKCGTIIGYHLRHKSVRETASAVIEKWKEQQQLSHKAVDHANTQSRANCAEARST